MFCCCCFYVTKYIVFCISSPFAVVFVVHMNVCLFLCVYMYEPIYTHILFLVKSLELVVSKQLNGVNIRAIYSFVHSRIQKNLITLSFPFWLLDVSLFVFFFRSICCYYMLHICLIWMLFIWSFLTVYLCVCRSLYMYMCLGHHYTY